ncbi:hypothetical protein GXP67_21290 [Rhodocytophaga rosea]|uniref:Uncharacterized protein n=1 Tax=Rhodocytophaga rosea TaxID=2704465 RepID=A0A6C0GMZ0_9BACT|nr:hypothetical protein [Rhodocytophaga rosea]QHT69003.1 hypothetical protein GXP67_21290 [Rhodocytophaga rosea]
MNSIDKEKVRWKVQQQCGQFWPCVQAGGLSDDFIWRKTGFVGAAFSFVTFLLGM